MDLRSGQRFLAGASVSTALPLGDFETYSAAGCIWKDGKWAAPEGAKTKGLSAVGAANYAMHPTTEVLSFYYDLLDGHGRRCWIPSMPNPTDLFEHLARGGLFEAWNVAFELWIWNEVCTKRYGWPRLAPEQVRCAMAKSRAWSMAGALGKAGAIMALDVQKDEGGKKLLDLFSIPRNPTKTNAKVRTLPQDAPVEFSQLLHYNERDVDAEEAAALRIPDLRPDDLAFWQAHEQVNRRGVRIDMTAVHDAIALIEQAFDRYNAELTELTGGAVRRASELARLKQWLATRGVFLEVMDEDAISEALPTITDLPARRALEIRSRVGSAAVKKLYAFRRLITPTGRVHDLFMFNEARSGRSSGSGVQPQNMPNSGPMVKRCEQCHAHYGRHLNACPSCNTSEIFSDVVEWGQAAVQDAIGTFTPRSLDWLEHIWGDAFPVIAGSLRGMFIAAEDHDLMVADYNAIEAVVAAMLSGEQWRIDVFNTHGMIYEMSASQITGIPLEEFIEHKKTHGEHHPARKKIGKVSELGGTFGGGVGSYLGFGARELIGDDEEIQKVVTAWREASPMLTRWWKEADNCALAALRQPGTVFEYRGLKWFVHEDVLYFQLLSGRQIAYHRPRVVNNRWGRPQIQYEGWNTNPKQGARGWITMEIYGGKWFNNACQATANDLLRHAIINLEAAGYHAVLHVHDEIVVEVPTGWGSVAEMQQIMERRPAWAADWPIRATGGWRGSRYGK
jgi:DNA polymerase